MASDGPEPNSTRGAGATPPPRPEGAEAAVSGATVTLNLRDVGREPAEPAEGGPTATTVVRREPPAVKGLSDGSAASRSGKAVDELEREIASTRAAGGDLAIGYALVRKLGTGSFGAVWEAENRLTHERVAIKFFTAGDADWEKLLNEVGLLQTVEGCRGIVLVKEVRPGAGDRPPMYVMQLANGGSLGDWIRDAGRLPPRERARAATEFFTQTARAMAAVHRRGIHHCDLKPQNVLLHHPEPGAAPEPLVADFGQGHLATDDTPALGTFFFMPPDQIDAAQAGTPPDTRWDVYALGAVAYEMLTGGPPRRSPELLDQIKKAPRNLAAKMALYRAGVVAAPRPVGHLGLVDRSLGRIIDRCLSLNPGTRPRDAGALVALLDARARWHRTRPVLALAAATTLLVVGLIACAGAALAREATRDQERYVTEEVKSCLTRTAGYGARAVEDRLARHIVSLEAYADKVHEDHPGVVAALAHADPPAGPTVQGPVLDEKGRDAVHKWLKGLQADRRRRAGKGDLPTLGLMLVTRPDAEGRARGFYAARLHTNDAVEDLRNTREPDLFTSDLSYRDYFYGGGDREGERELPHTVVDRSHISQPFRSRGSDLAADGTARRPWKLNIVAPVWDKPKADTRRVIGLIVLGLDVERDLESLVHPREFDDESEHRPIAKEIKVVLVDHRQQWVWHPDCKNGALARPEGPAADDRLPHSYAQLARDRGRAPEEVCPWLGRPGPGGGRPGYVTSHDYVDLVESRIDHRGAGGEQDEPEIACFMWFNPYRLSEREAAPPGPRPWVFVAQVDRKLALAPLRELEQRLVAIGAGAGAALVLLALVLWAWLFRVLRRLELASHS